MTPPDCVELGDLGEVGATLGEGGQGVVSRLPSYDISNEAGPFLVKTYGDDALVAPQSLMTLVRFRSSLETHEARRLLEVSAWPLQVVQSEGRAIGITMQVAPTGFWQVVRGPRGPRDALREASWLLTDESRPNRFGVPVPDDGARKAICRELAAAIALLHENGVVYGDLSARNVLWTTDPEPAIYLLDCDGARRVGSAAPLAQLDSPDWGDPVNTSLQSVESDLFKFGLFVTRVFARSLHETDPTAAGRALGRGAAQLLSRALSTAAPSARPTLEEWLDFFDTGRSTSVPMAQGAVPAPAADGWRKVDGEWIRSGGTAGASSRRTPPARRSPEERWELEDGTWVRARIDPNTP